MGEVDLTLPAPDPLHHRLNVALGEDDPGLLPCPPDDEGLHAAREGAEGFEVEAVLPRGLSVSEVRRPDQGLLRLSEEPGCPREGLRGPRVVAGEDGEDLVADRVPQEAPVLVRRVVAERDPLPCAEGARLLPGEEDEGADVGGRGRENPPEPARACAAEEVEEDGLRDIGSRMAERDLPRTRLARRPREELPAHEAGSFLQVELRCPGEGRHVHPVADEGEAKAHRRPLHHGEVLRRVRPDPVVEVGHGQGERELVPQTVEGMEEGQRIRSPGHGDEDTLPSAKEPVPADRLPNPSEHRPPRWAAVGLSGSACELPAP